MHVRGSKRPRPRARELQDLIGQVPTKKLSSIVSAISDLRGNLGGLSRQTLDQSLHDELDPLIEVVPLKKAEGGEYIWKILEPNRLLAHVVESSPELAACYLRAAHAHEPTLENPWDLMICFDEFVPGDKLKIATTRKSMVLGFNFRQLGPEVPTQMLIHRKC